MTKIRTFGCSGGGGTKKVGYNYFISSRLPNIYTTHRLSFTLLGLLSRFQWRVYTTQPKAHVANKARLPSLINLNIS